MPYIQSLAAFRCYEYLEIFMVDMNTYHFRRQEKCQQSQLEIHFILELLFQHFSSSFSLSIPTISLRLMCMIQGKSRTGSHVREMRLSSSPAQLVGADIFHITHAIRPAWTTPREDVSSGAESKAAVISSATTRCIVGNCVHSKEQVSAP